MAKRIAETNLILQKDGSVYHLNLLPHHVGDTVIAVGDPNRVYQVSQHFDDIEVEINQREFITHVGTYKGRKLTVISTGIGTDNIEICLTEIDALVNIDLKTREEKSNRKNLTVIRIGTSGALQEDIPVGTHLVTDYAVGFDNLMQFYSLPQDDFESTIANDLKRQTEIDFLPYVVRGSSKLRDAIGFDMVRGNTVTAPGFYAPQGRELRIPIRYPKLLEQLNYFHNREYNFWLTNFEMESAGYYAMGRLLGHQMLSVNAILANRVTNEFAGHPAKIMDALISKVLERIVSMS
jgi:uridine phosphorylase